MIFLDQRFQRHPIDFLIGELVSRQSKKKSLSLAKLTGQQTTVHLPYEKMLSMQRLAAIGVLRSRVRKILTALLVRVR